MSLAVEMSHGRVPYRDFFLWSTPLHAFEHLALLELFGPNVLVGHLVGMLSRVATGVLLYAWLSKRAQPALAAMASVAAITVFSDDPADSVFYYHQQAMLYAVAAGYAAACAIDRRASRSGAAVAALAGVLAALSLLTKHTVGSATCAAIAIPLAAACSRDAGSRRFLPVGALLAGIGAPLAAFFVWLAANGALTAFLLSMQVGSSSKGPLATSLTRIVTTPFLEHQNYLTPVVLAVTLAAGVFLFGPRAGAWGRGARSLAATGVVAAGALLAAVHLDRGEWDLRVPQLVAVELGVWGTFAILLVSGWRLLHGDVREVQRFHLALLGFAIAYALALSWGEFEFMALPSFAIVACEAAGARGQEGAGRPWLPVGGVVLACALFAASAEYVKVRKPFDWMGWREAPVEYSQSTSDLKPLAGMEMSSNAAAFFRKVTRRIVAHSNPGDPIFVYPHLPIFYVLADCRPATYAPIHFWDVCPDEVAEVDAEQLLASPPKVIVFVEIPESVVETLEAYFRGGKRSGQRAIDAAISKLSPGYDLVGKEALLDPFMYAVVLARSDKPQPGQ